MTAEKTPAPSPREPRSEAEPHHSAGRPPGQTGRSYLELQPARAGLEADTVRRTIAGVIVPWDTYAVVSTGQRAAFAPGSLTVGPHVKLNLDHDPTQPVGVLASSEPTDAGMVATFRIPAGPRGDQALADAAAGLRDGLSIGADIDAADATDAGTYVTAARARHVALLSEPAYESARVTHVAASTPPNGEQPAMTTTATLAASGTEPEPAEPEPVEPEPDTLTAAGRAQLAAGLPGVYVRDPYPYALAQRYGGPSFVRDAYESETNPGSPAADRWRRAQAMADDPAFISAALARVGGSPPAALAAATGTTTGNPDIAFPHQAPERFVPLLSPKAPLYSAITKYGTPDFNSILVPREVSNSGLSGKPTDEVTPIAPGTVTTATDTIVIDEVEGGYLFSRKLLMGSNPSIDQIALAAMDRAWLTDVETRATTFFTTAANSTAASGTYADGPGYITALRGTMAAMASATLFDADVAIPAGKEYNAAAAANDSAGRPLLVYGPAFNAPGTSGAGYEALTVQGVPLLPGPFMLANKTILIDQEVAAAAVFATPVMNFRLEWTTDATTGGNAKVLKLVKYSGVGFWTQYKGGVVCLTNTTPLALAASVEMESDEPESDEAPARKGK